MQESSWARRSQRSCGWWPSSTLQQRLRSRCGYVREGGTCLGAKKTEDAPTCTSAVASCRALTAKNSLLFSVASLILVQWCPVQCIFLYWPNCSPPRLSCLLYCRRSSMRPRWRRWPCRCS